MPTLGDGPGGRLPSGAPTPQQSASAPLGKWGSACPSNTNWSLGAAEPLQDTLTEPYPCSGSALHPTVGDLGRSLWA